MKKLYEIRGNPGTLADHDEEQRRVTDIFDTVNEARVQLEVSRDAGAHLLSSFAHLFSVGHRH